MKDKLQPQKIISIDQIKMFETPTGVSDKYIPIYTSELIKFLEPEFNFESGIKIGKTSHYIDLIKFDKSERIRIYNSFDGSLALRIYLISDDLHLNIIDNDRIIHRGERAKNITAQNEKTLQEIKDSILSIIPNTKMLVSNLKNIKIDINSEIVKEIKKVFTECKLSKQYKQGKTHFEFVNYVDIIAKKAKENNNPLSIYQYINLNLKNFFDGNYGIKDIKTGNVKSGRKMNSAFGKLIIINKINKMIIEKLPEYYI